MVQFLFCLAQYDAVCDRPEVDLSVAVCVLLNMMINPIICKFAVFSMVSCVFRCFCALFLISLSLVCSRS